MKLSIAYPALALIIGIGLIACDDPSDTPHIPVHKAEQVQASEAKPAQPDSTADTHRHAEAHPAGSEGAGSERAGSERAGSERAGSERAGSVGAASEGAGSVGAASEGAGSERVAGEEPARTEKERPAAEPSVDLDAKLSVKRLVVSRGVEDREPVGTDTVFSAEAGRLYAFVEVGNEDRADSEVYVSFKREGAKEGGRIRLRVGASPRWRTWAFTRLVNEPGKWHAIVRDGRGRELGRTSFAIEGDGAKPTAAATKKKSPPQI